jgi:myo-inositol 2-dehydrogenase/D-chiro-inositol 1-dehydrogenase
MDRRKFVGAAAAASGILLLKPKTVFGYEANSAVRLALLGCGSRGTSVAESFLNNTSARVVALADLFPDKLEPAKTRIDQVGAQKGYSAIDPKLMFHGYKAYEEIASSPDVDAVQISTTPWFHVQHLDAAVRGGKHVYCEKPIGVDVAQSKQALEIGKRAEGHVSLEVGFQIRSAPPFMEMIRHIQQGALGKIGIIAANYNAPRVSYLPMPNMSPDELRIRRWYWDRVLSGDIIVEQAIHLIDICNWALQAHPIKATGTGGRNIISHPGDTWDNYEIAFTYPGNVHVSFSCTQFGPNDWFDVSARMFGADGHAEIPYSGPMRIVGEKAWTWVGDQSAQPAAPTKFAANGVFSDNLAQAQREKDRGFIDSITSGNFHNQSAAGVETALSAMLGRMAGRLGREVTWEELMQHGENYELGINMTQFS